MHVSASGQFSWSITGPSGTGAPAGVPGLNAPGGSVNISFLGYAPGNYSMHGQVNEANGAVVDCGTWAITVAAPRPVVTNATYGANQGATSGNWSSHVQPYCNTGKSSCSFAPYLTFGADPYPFQVKDFSVYWTCDGILQPVLYVPGEAGFTTD